MLRLAISTSATQQQGYHIHQEIYYKLQTKDQKERERKKLRLIDRH